MPKANPGIRKQTLKTSTEHETRYILVDKGTNKDTNKQIPRLEYRF